MAPDALISDAVLTEIDFPPFRERAPWLGPDLQTLRNFLMRRLGRAPTDLPGERRLLPVADGGHLAARLSPGDPDRPLALLIHGLTGCETATNMVVAAHYLNGMGYPVLRLNLRGSEPSRPTAHGHYHAGRTEDLRDVLSSLDPALVRAGIVALGFSIGGNLLLKFLAEHGDDVPIRAAAAVSTPIDLAASATNFERARNRLYQEFLLRRIRLQWTIEKGEAELRRILAAVRTIREFDERVQAPANGFRGADDYYAQSSAVRYMPEIRVPTLVLHARNDPWIGPAAYDGFDWRRNRNLTLLMPDRGGHVGFHAADSAVPWHCRCIGRFFAVH